MRCASCGARDQGLCGAFGGDGIASLHTIGRRRRAPAGQVLIWAGDPITFCATLVSGALKIVRHEADGRQQIVGLLFPGDFVGEPFAEHAAESLIALADADLCVYPRAQLRWLLQTHPPAARVLLHTALASLTRARRWILTLGRRDAQEKVAGFLLDMAEHHAGTETFELPMGRAAVGEALGLTIETVSRQMTALRRAGAIALPGGRTVELRDRMRLRTLAGL
ncbi:Crp/Fnr family transcriptional regulator [Sphingomonas sp. S2-65]|uniref:Crp/Fnr family transcriptional regulator n=1 Tax=Sphingomonas sp. S2-65 TaxID=2903960 RepID=UPI001F277A60|nr:Crp/Fnr family transcriptional regulator [Sphingomonas sp. S2-65]UYY57110.1 Crp/Fnr family transcriptional regulator [Sphingomonas sp. S2-65]